MVFHLGDATSSAGHGDDVGRRHHEGRVGDVLGGAEESVEHDAGALDEGEYDATKEGGAGGGASTLAHLEEPTGGGAGDNGVPGVLLLA